MKTIVYCISLFLMFGCSKRQEANDEVNTEKDSIKGVKNMVNYLLDSEREKLVLLSTIENIHYDTLYQILSDYKTFSCFSTGMTEYENVLDLTHSRHSISKRKLARLIFAFDYEMLTKQEIVDDGIEEMEESAQEDQSYEDYSRY